MSGRLQSSEPDSSAIDLRALRAYRLGRVQAEMNAAAVGAALMFDPLNIRYATDARNMTLWKAHSWGRYAFLPADRGAIVFDAPGSLHQNETLETVAESRPSTGLGYIYGGEGLVERTAKWAAEIADLVALHCRQDKRLAIDRIDPLGASALARHGIELVDVSRIMERARLIKSKDEIACMKIAVAACEAGMWAMHRALAPGMTENELWSLLHQANIARDGEWIETRCLASGKRTNPWLQECSDRVIHAGELVAFDTDLIGPFGYMADISRTYYCGHAKATDEQRRLYSLSYEQIQHDVALLAPGMEFAEFAERAWQIPDEFVANRYGCVAHGVGMCDEYPTIGYPTGPGLGNVDGTFEPGMTICVESYIGADTGVEGVKLEQQLLVTERGTELLSTFPFEEELL